MKSELYKDSRKADRLNNDLKSTQTKLQAHFKGYSFEGVSITDLQNLSVEKLREALEAIIYRDVDQLKAFGDEVLESALNSRKRKVEAEVEAYKRIILKSSPTFNAENLLYLENGIVKVNEAANDYIYNSCAVILDHPMGKDVAKSLLKLSAACSELKSMGYGYDDIRGLVDGLRQDGYSVGEVTAIRAREVFRPSIL